MTPFLIDKITHRKKEIKNLGNQPTIWEYEYNYAINKVLFFIHSRLVGLAGVDLVLPKFFCSFYGLFLFSSPVFYTNSLVFRQHLPAQLKTGRDEITADQSLGVSSPSLVISAATLTFVRDFVGSLS